MSFDEAAAAILSSPFTIAGWNCRSGFKPLTVKSLLIAYGVTDPIESILPVAVPGRGQGRLVAQLRDVLPAIGSGAPSSRLEEAPAHPGYTSRTGSPASCRPRTNAAPASIQLLRCHRTLRWSGASVAPLPAEEPGPPPAATWFVIDENCAAPSVRRLACTAMRAQIAV